MELVIETKQIAEADKSHQASASEERSSENESNT